MKYAVAALLLVVEVSAVHAGLKTFTDRDRFTAAVAVLSTDGFEDTVTAVDVTAAGLDRPGYKLSFTAEKPESSAKLLPTLPKPRAVAGDRDAGLTYDGEYWDFAELTFTFDQPITAFAVDTSPVATNALLIVIETANGPDVIDPLPVGAKEGFLGPFFGVTSSEPITSITFEQGYRKKPKFAFDDVTLGTVRRNE
ncbi:MAG: hypothetical protein AAF532_10175 [Planctomycetota bacterium]